VPHRPLPVQHIPPPPPTKISRFLPPIPPPKLFSPHDATCALMAMRCMQFPCVRYLSCSCQSCACMCAFCAYHSSEHAGTLTNVPRSCGHDSAMHASVLCQCTFSCCKFISMHIVRGLQGYTVALQQHQKCTGRQQYIDFHWLSSQLSFLRLNHSSSHLSPQPHHQHHLQTQLFFVSFHNNLTDRHTDRLTDRRRGGRGRST